MRMVNFSSLMTKMFVSNNLVAGERILAWLDAEAGNLAECPCHGFKQEGFTHQILII